MQFKAYKTEAIVFALFSIAILCFAWLSKPERHGDGHEYSIISEAIIDHGTPDIRVGDITRREALMDEYPQDFYNRSCFEGIRARIESNGDAPRENYGFFQARDDRYYGFHFWFYPYYEAVFESIAGGLGANPFAGFQIANAFVFIFVAWYCLFVPKLPTGRKLWLAAAFMGSGAIFYLKWTHPEVFIAGFIFLGFVALFERKKRLAVVFLSLAAVQVVTIWTVFAAVIFMILVVQPKEFFGEILKFIKTWWLWIFALLPASSMIFFYIEFGTPSLIGNGHINMGQLCLPRFVSFWFDLDQGVFVGAPWLLLFFAAYLIAIRKCGRECHADLAIALFGAVCICLPLIVHSGINAGQSVFGRYGLYAVAPIAAWAGYHFADVVGSRWARWAIFIFGAGYIAYFKGPCAAEDYASHKVWVQKILENFPEYYNPDPAIFGVRTIGDESWKMYSDVPVVFRTKDGLIRKILIRERYSPKTLDALCIGRIADEKGNDIATYPVTHIQRGWGYINGVFHCEGLDLSLYQCTPNDNAYESDLESGIVFAKEGFPRFVRCTYGIFYREKLGRWSDGKYVIVGIVGDLPSEFTLHISAATFQPYVGKSVTVTIENVERSFVADTADFKDYQLHFVLPKKKSDPYVIIHLVDPCSPKSLGMSDDDRKLALFFNTMSLEY